MKQLSRAIAAVLFAGLAIGCSQRANPTDERRYFVLEARRTEPAEGAKIGGVLVVRRFAAARGFGGAELVYRTGEHSFESDYYHRLLQPPGSQIAEQTRQWISRAGLFDAVVNAGSEAPATYVLEGNITELYADFRQEGRPSAVMAAAFFLVTPEGRQPTVTFHREYRATSELTSGSAAAVAEAHSRCLEEILRKLEADLRALARKEPMAAPEHAGAP